MNKNDIIGKEFVLDLDQTAPVSVVVKDVTEDKIIVEYIYSESPRIVEEYTKDDFKYFAKLNFDI